MFDDFVGVIVWVIIIFLFTFVAGEIIFAICSLVLKKGSLIKSKKSLIYVSLAALGSILLAVTFSFVALQFSSIYHLSFYYLSLLCFLFLFPLLLTLYNYWLSKKFFDLQEREAIFISLMMGTFTGPALFLLYGLLLLSGLE